MKKSTNMKHQKQEDMKPEKTAPVELDESRLEKVSGGSAAEQETDSENETKEDGYGCLLRIVDIHR